MAKPLAETCLYTLLSPDRLEAAVELRGPSTFVVEQRMVTAQDHFRLAQDAGEDFVVLFGDATNCSRLLGWALLTAMNVANVDATKKDTHLTVFSVRPLKPERRTQDLKLVSTAKKIAANYIRPYAVCRTPKFLPRS